mgnify:CR=1 FL=1
MQEDNINLRFTVLGSGTSSGIPTIGCKCSTCASDDPKDKRLRTSLLVESPTTTVVIDTSPDFRQQMLASGVSKLDGVVYTHHHFDHIGGFDDIRAFNYATRRSMPVYINKKTFAELKRTFIYAFETPEQLGGGVPMIDIRFIDHETFSIGDIHFQPLSLYHGKFEILGFKIGNLAYCTDTNFLPGETIEMISGIDYLILDALRFTEHPTHFSLDQAIDVSRKVNASETCFIHMAHQIRHEEIDPGLPEGINLAYDGLVLNGKL